MKVVLYLLLAQCALGAFDSLWHHEITERLPQRRSARGELVLHAIREFLYAIVFIGLAWREWRGTWAWMLGVILLVEVVITIADFLEEDRTRSLPRLERVVHTVLAVNYGVWLGVFAPIAFAWSAQETSLAPVTYGWLSIALTVAGIGVFVWSLRNGYAALKHMRPPTWVRNPIFVGSTGKPRVVLITGATGFIGSALTTKLLSRGDSVIALTRNADKALDLFGPHVRIVTSLDQLPDGERIDAIVNLAGARILSFPWTRSRRKALLDSRMRTTEQVVRLCERLRRAPAVLVSGSAIGYYGIGDVECDEYSEAQSQFQSELCQRWEFAALAAKTLGVRVVLLRTGLVLGTQGGALPMMSLPVRMGVGAVLGTGKQWMSWIHLADLIRMTEFALDRQTLDGPLNAVAPKPVTHAEFQHALARRLHRPMLLRIPAWILNGMLGEMAQLLVDGQKVAPRKCGVHGFRFKHPTLKLALESLFPAMQAQHPHAADVYYNGNCPVCSTEMAHYSKLAAKDSLPLCFVDSIRNPLPFAHYGLRIEHLERRVYVRDERGRVTSGLPAILQLWARLPGYRWAAKVVALPGIRQLAVAAYDLAVAPSLAWWAHRKHSNLIRS